MTPERRAAQRIAVLIDADQFSPDMLDAVMDEAKRHGTVVVVRAYRHWPKPMPKGWTKAQEEHGVEAVEQAPGPNATDMALVMDAVDLIHDRGLDGFLIVTNDRDFGPLAGRLRRGRLRAVLIADPKKASAEYRALWDGFLPLPVGIASSVRAKPSGTKPTPEECEDARRVEAYRTAIATADRDGEDYALLSAVGRSVDKGLRPTAPAKWLGERPEFEVVKRKFKNGAKEEYCVRVRKPQRRRKA